MIVVCGNMVQDVLVRAVEEPIAWGASTIVDAIAEHMGGNGANTSYTLGKLGVPVALMSLAGRDAAADSLIARLQSVDVDTAMVKRTAAQTSAVVALVAPDGRRALLYQLGASAESFDKPLQLPGSATHFHLAAVYRMRDLRSAAPEFMRAAKQAGLITSVDTQWDHEGEWLPVLAPTLPYADLLFVNEDEGRELTGLTEASAIALALRDLGAREVVVKLGAKGCFASTVEGDFHSPARSVKVVDTTGAGDCFVGGYLAGRYQGKSHCEAARLANHMGSLSVGRLGATEGLVDFLIPDQR
jgi:sugar/nucleoside kinase (ribokinase family)